MRALGMYTEHSPAQINVIIDKNATNNSHLINFKFRNILPVPSFTVVNTRSPPLVLLKRRVYVDNIEICLEGGPQVQGVEISR